MATGSGNPPKRIDHHSHHVSCGLNGHFPVCYTANVSPLADCAKLTNLEFWLLPCRLARSVDKCVMSKSSLTGSLNQEELEYCRAMTWENRPVRAKAKSGACAECYNTWVAKLKSVQTFIDERWAGLATFYERVFDQRLGIACSASVAAFAAGTSFQNTRHGSPSHWTDRCTLVLHGPVAKWEADDAPAEVHGCL